MNKLKKGDQVVVIAGKDKGRKGVILSVLRNNRLLVEGINTAKKHVKSNPNTGEQGGVVIVALPIHISNVMIYNVTTEKGDRVGIKVLADGQKARYYKSTDELVDV